MRRYMKQNKKNKLLNSLLLTILTIVFFTACESSKLDNDVVEVNYQRKPLVILDYVTIRKFRVSEFSVDTIYDAQLHFLTTDTTHLNCKLGSFKSNGRRYRIHFFMDRPVENYSRFIGKIYEYKNPNNFSMFKKVIEDAMSRNFFYLDSCNSNLVIDSLNFNDIVVLGEFDSGF
jgi:hypothetical protein